MCAAEPFYNSFLTLVKILKTSSPENSAKIVTLSWNSLKKGIFFIFGGFYSVNFYLF